MNAITHPVEPEQLMAFVDGELTAAEAQQVSAHIAECTECASLAAELRATSSDVAEWRVAAVPKSVEETVAGYVTRANLGLRIARRKGSHRLWTWKRWAVFGGAAAAFAVLALVMSLSALKPSRPRLDGAEIVATPAARQVEPKDQPIDGQSAADSKLSPSDALEPAPSAESNGALGGVIGGKVTSKGGTNTFGTDDKEFAQVEQFAKIQSAPMIARTVSLTIVVKDFVAARSSLDAILARHQGYAAQMNVSTPEYSARSLQASLRVPAPMLVAAVADLKTLGRVEDESQSGEEVTRQHEDLLARLKTARETEERFRAILNQRTGTVSDVLQVEEGIARVRGEIEQMEAEQNALDHRVDFATIELQLNEEYKAELNAPESAGTRMHNAFVAGFQNVGGSIFGLILFLEEYGPVLLIWVAILAVPIIFFRRRYKKALATTP